MNTITKIVLSLVLHGLYVTVLYAQLLSPYETQYKHVSYQMPQSDVDFERLPTHFSHPKAPSFRNEIIKPIKAVLYNPRVGSSIEDPFIKYDYFYDTKGMLVKEIQDILLSKEIKIIDYNNKFPVTHNYYYTYNSYFYDTSTYYKSDNMEPIDRYYYEYGIEQADVPYIALVSQQWNKSKARWDNLSKTSYTYLDMVSWYVMVHEAYTANSDNSFSLWYKRTDSLIYDESNNIFQVVQQATDFNVGATGKMLFEYHYPVDAHDNITGYDSLYFYQYDNISDTWVVRGKQTGITWKRWDGFNYESNQMSSFHGWYANGYEGYDLWGQQKSWYDVDGIAGSWADTIYFYSDLYERWYPKATDSQTYDEEGNFCVDRNIGWTELELTGGVPELEWYNIDVFDNEYNDDGMLWRWSNYYTSIQLGQQDLLIFIWEVTEFADVTNISELPQGEKSLLTIFPNPVSGVVTIAAASAIQQLSIFDITGRLVASPSPAGERVVFDTGALPQGVYIVRALLRDGGVRTGKLIKN